MSVDLAYIAGLVDGEGTVTLTKISNPKAFRTPVLSISSTDIELLHLPVKILGGEIKAKQAALLKGWKQAFEYRIRGLSAIDALIAIRPYMRHPQKCLRTDLIISDYNNLTVRNGKYTQNQRLLKEKFEQDFFAL